MLNRRDYLIFRFAPLVSCRVGVVDFSEDLDASLQFCSGAIYAALQLVLRQLCEAQFELIYPGCPRSQKDSMPF